MQCLKSLQRKNYEKHEDSIEFIGEWIDNLFVIGRAMSDRVNEADEIIEPPFEGPALKKLRRQNPQGRKGSVKLEYDPHDPENWNHFDEELPKNNRNLVLID